MSHRSVSPNDRLFSMLTAVVLLAPLPLGANRLWSWSALSLLVAALGVAWGVQRLRGGAHGGLPLRRLALPAALFLAAAGWGILQCVPIFPESWVYPVWHEAGTALGRHLSGVISGDPEKSVDTVMRLLTYGVVFTLATQLGRRRYRAARAMIAVAVSGVVYGAAALGFHVFGVEYVLWLPKWAYIGDTTGTFVGRTAFGAFAGIGVVTCLAQAIHGHVSRLPTIGPGARVERLLARVVPWLAAALFLFLAVLASHSRGALLVTVASGLILIAAAAMGGLLRVRHAAVCVVALAIAMGTVVLAEGDVTMSRMWGEGDWHGDRPNLLRLTWAAIGDAPFVGHGAGAFEPGFHAYRDLNLPRDVIYTHAHNAWAEVVMTLGWPAGLCLVFAIVAVTVVCAMGVVRRRQDKIYPAWAVAVACLLGGQAMIDFTVQIPALAVLLAYVLGIGYAQAWSMRSGASDETGTPAALV